MAYVTVATRLPKEDENELKALMVSERLDKSAAARKAIELGLAEWRKEISIKQLRQGRVSIGRAAELAGITIWEMLSLVEEKRIDYIHIPEAELEEELALVSKR